VKKFVYILLLTVVLGFTLKQHQQLPTELDVTSFTAEYLNISYKDAQIEQLLFVSVKYQRMYLIRYGHIVSEYSISTSKFGVGNKMYSQKTPTGIHWIKKKMGRRTPVNGILKGGGYTGEIADIEYQPITTNRDLITSRVLWLEGMEWGINHGGNNDSYNRKIYIHGTHEEGLIGKPASHGCIRMKNHDVTELYDLVEKGLYVLILNV
jgi:lipoprotein-anchoring transpeptidase ErfK/SrfK